MNLFTIAWKSIRQRALASTLTALSVALGVMLMSSVLVLHGIITRTFSQDTFGYDLLVGAKGGDLQLVLSSIYRIQPPVENLPYLYYLKLQDDRRIDVLIPIALGDNTQEGNFPIVGTIPAHFTNDYAFKKPFMIRGTNFKKTLDAIIGSEVARRNGWDIGSKFQLIHGGQDEHTHPEFFTVVGVLQRTGTANDKTAFVALDGFLDIADHSKSKEEGALDWIEFIGKTRADYSDAEFEDLKNKPHITKEITSIFLKVRRRPAKDGSKLDDSQAKASNLTLILYQEFRKGNKANAVNPVVVMSRLINNIIGNIQMVLLILISLIIVVAGLSIFVSIYNSMADRRKEIAIMRALGARRSTVFSIILSESILLCVGGGFAGFALGHIVVFFAAPYVEHASGLLIDPIAFEATELILIPAMIVLASLVGFVPGLTAYRTDVAKALSD